MTGGRENIDSGHNGNLVECRKIVGDYNLSKRFKEGHAGDGVAIYDEGIEARRTEINQASNSA